MFSVIVPYKNAEGWILRCAESLKKQTADAEFIFVNDGSTDNGKKILTEFATDPRFRLLENKKKPGVSGARNTGLDAAQGDWIKFVDVDDEMLPDGLSVFNRLIRQFPNDDIIQTNHLRDINGVNKIVSRHSADAGLYGIEDLPNAWIVVWNKVYRKETIGKIRFSETLQFGEDELFNLAVLAQGAKIRHADRPVVTMLKHFTNDKSLARTKTESDLLKMIKALQDFLKKQTDPAVRRTLCRRLSAHWGSEMFLKIIGGEDE